MNPQLLQLPDSSIVLTLDTFTTIEEVDGVINDLRSRGYTIDAIQLAADALLAFEAQHSLDTRILGLVVSPLA